VGRELVGHVVRDATVLAVVGVDGDSPGADSIKLLSDVSYGQN
jgi:hypothetical protein